MADVSLAFGGCYISSSASTTLSATTPAKAAGTTTSMGLNGFSHPASNRIQYTGTATRTFHVTATVSAQHSGSGSTAFSLWLYKNDIVISGTEIVREIASVGDTGAVATQALVSLATNDYVEIWVETDDGDDIELEFGTLIARVAG